MSDPLTRLFAQFDHGGISRRQLLQALGIAAVGVPLSKPFEAFAQGRCGDANAGTPACDTMPAKAPFAVTGWRTVMLDRFTLQVADYQKETAYYAALMNWKIRSDDGKQAVLDIGDIGSVVIRGGYVAPPAPAGGGGGGGGGRGGGGAGAPPLPPGCTSLMRPARSAAWDSITYGIEPWDTKKVESELKKRGLNPEPVHEGKDFQSFRVTAPDGMIVAVSNGNKKNRRTTPATGKTGASAPFESTNWQTMYLDHISYQSPNYKESFAFYNALLGWTGQGDEGSQNTCYMGDAGEIIIRGGGPPRVPRPDTPAAGRAAAAAANPPAATPRPAPRRTASIDHISFGIAGFDPDSVKAELDKRCLTSSADTGSREDIHTAPYKSYHTTTTNGFNLQISNKVARTTR